MTKIDLCRTEFGWGLSMGLCILHSLKKQGIEFDVDTPVWLPDDMAGMISNTYNVTIESDAKEGTKFLGSKLQKNFIASHCKPISVFCEPVLDEKYVCIIPSVIARTHGKFDMLNTLLIENWIKIANFVRSKDYKVVAFGRSDRTSEDIVKSVGDIHLFWDAEMYPLTNMFLFEQLKYMKQSKLTIAFGGAGHIAFAFDVPGFSVDLGMGYIPQNFFTSVLRNRSTRFWSITNTWEIIKAKFVTKSGIRYEDYRHYMTDIIINELEGIL